jgi:hypothetical protein
MNGEPPRWAEFALSLLLKAGDRESIPGDLLEQYREDVLPRTGWLRSQLWYGRQVASLFWHLLPSASFGAALGLALSAGVVGSNVILPLLPAAAAMAHGPQAAEAVAQTAIGVGILLLWTVAGYRAWRRGGELLAAVRAGALAALVSMGMVMATFFVIDNLFLDLVSRQPEKIWGFRHSGYQSMRAFINHGLLRGLLLALPVMTAFGAAAGALGGLVARIMRRRRPGSPGETFERARRG